MNTTKRILGMGLAVALLAGGASVTAVAPSQAEPSAAKQDKDSKPGEAGAKKKEIKQGDKPAASAEEEKTRGFKKGQKAVETMGTMGKEKTKEETKP